VYIDREGQQELRRNIAGTHALMWTQVVSWVAGQVEAEPPRSLEGDFRRTGDLIPYAALCYLTSGDKAYRDLAIRFMLGITACEHWGDDKDIEAAHLLYGLALGYDWLYAELGEADRIAVRDKIRLQGRRLRPFCGVVHPPLNNHRVVKLSALGVAGLALYPQSPSARWLAFVNEAFDKTLKYVGQDGMSCEGISYWSYSTEYLLKYFVAADELLGTAFLQHPWIRNAADSPLHYAMPPGAWTAHNMFLNVADSPRFCWYGPHYQLYKLASLERRPEVQWLAEQIQKSGFTRYHADWLALLWYDASLAAHPPKDLPLTKIFTDWDLAVMRSEWARGATICSFRCSPIGGHQVEGLRRPVYPGSGHCHPDANSFTIFSRGEWLAVDAGASLVKETRHHNTLLVNGVGQLGEGRRWLDGKAQFRRRHKPRFVFTQSGPGYDYFVGDASDVYREEACLRKFLRHFLYVRPDLVIIVDEFESSRPVVFEWRLNTPGTLKSTGPDGVLVEQGKARLQIAAVRPADAVIAIGKQNPATTYPEEQWNVLQGVTITHAAPVDKGCFVVVARTGDQATEPFTCSVEDDTREMTITVASGGDTLQVRLHSLARPRDTMSLIPDGQSWEVSGPGR
jgi:hypothetical protein